MQNILDRKIKVNKDGSLDPLSGILKCKYCGSNRKVITIALIITEQKIVKIINQYQKVYWMNL